MPSRSYCSLEFELIHYRSSSYAYQSPSERTPTLGTITPDKDSYTNKNKTKIIFSAFHFHILYAEKSTPGSGEPKLLIVAGDRVMLSNGNNE